MSQNQSDQSAGREVAHRVFATEFNDATYTFQESDEDRAPVYALLPTGEKANRVFIIGTLTETNNVGNDEDYWQGRIVGPTGTVFAYAGQYQPDAAAFLRDIEPPAFVAIVGKPRSYETDEGMVNVSLRPEHITEVDKQARHRWVSETASRTLDRIEGFDTETNPYARMAREQYGGNIEQYRQQVIEALETLDDVSTQEDETGATAPTTDEEDTPTANAEEIETASGSSQTASSRLSGDRVSDDTSDDPDQSSESHDDEGGETPKRSNDELSEFDPEI